MFTPAPRPGGPRNRAPSIENKRGDGLERRPLVGTRGSAKLEMMTLRHADVSGALFHDGRGVQQKTDHVGFSRLGAGIARR